MHVVIEDLKRKEEFTLRQFCEQWNYKVHKGERLSLGYDFSRQQFYVSKFGILPDDTFTVIFWLDPEEFRVKSMDCDGEKGCSEDLVAVFNQFVSVVNRIWKEERRK